MPFSLQMEHRNIALAGKVKPMQFFIDFALVIYLDENKCVLTPLLWFYAFFIRILLFLPLY